MRPPVSALLLLPVLAFAQEGGTQDPPVAEPPPSAVKRTAKEARAEAIYLKMRQVDLLTQLMPLVLTKKQIDQLLTALEKARKDQQIILDAEAGQMAAMEKEIDAALKEAEESGKYPPREIRGRIYGTTSKMSTIRMAARDGIMLRLDEAVLKILNEGQIRAMVGTFRPEELNSVKPESVTDEMRRRAYVGNILLDPQCYDVLRKLFRKAS